MSRAFYQALLIFAAAACKNFAGHVFLAGLEDKIFALVLTFIMPVDIIHNV
jgi:hypothetical protein